MYNRQIKQYYGLLCFILNHFDSFTGLDALLLLIPQSFDWLAAFHLDLLQAILSIAL